MFKLFLLFGYYEHFWLQWTFVYKFFCGHVFRSRSGIARSYGNYVNCLKNCHTLLNSRNWQNVLNHLYRKNKNFTKKKTCGTVFQIVCSIFHSHQQCMKVLISPYSCYFIIYLPDFSHPGWCQMVSHCDFDLYFPNNNHSEYLFMCFLAICLSLEKSLFKYSAHFWVGLYVFLLLSL